MTQAPLLLLVLGALCACSSSSPPVFTQPPSLQVPPGGTAKLPCIMSSGFSVSSYYIFWYQQRPGSPPRYLMRISPDSTNAPGSGVPARFSGSKDLSSNSCILTIAGVLAEDDADYYCGMDYAGGGIAYTYIFGRGTQMNVNTGEIKAPTMSIFPPSTEEIAGKKATLVCQCQNYYPAALVWSWTENGQAINTGVDSTRPTKQTENNLFMAASFLSIDAVDWNANKKYTCLATHEGKTIQASVKQSECV